MKNQSIIAVIMGSQSDESAIQKGLAILDDFSIPYECHVLSAHRNPNRVAIFAKSARSRGTKVIIAVAGLAAALPGVIAAHTTLPVIGMPVDTGPLRGQDALLAIAQMPPGIPVATVGIGNARNAALLALSILSVSSKHIEKKLLEFRKRFGD